MHFHRCNNCTCEAQQGTGAEIRASVSRVLHLYPSITSSQKNHKKPENNNSCAFVEL